jgi:ligand-binding sensor domain-containing protein
VYPEFPARGVFAISDYGIDNIVAGTDRGLALWNGKKWTLINKQKGLLAIPVKCIVRNGSALWLGGYYGLQRWTPTQQGLLLTQKDGLPSTQITCMTKDKNNNILIGTEKGAAFIKTAP